LSIETVGWLDEPSITSAVGWRNTSREAVTVDSAISLAPLPCTSASCVDGDAVSPSAPTDCASISGSGVAPNSVLRSGAPNAW
jgi:hypothetical protein